MLTLREFASWSNTSNGHCCGRDEQPVLAGRAPIACGSINSAVTGTHFAERLLNFPFLANFTMRELPTFGPALRQRRDVALLATGDAGLADRSQGRAAAP